MLKIEKTNLEGCVVVKPDFFGDHRGGFMETFNKDKYSNLDIYMDVVQSNMSRTEQRGTIRGLHFQREPFAQAKLVQCIKGAIYDVALDLRKSSPTYGQYTRVQLDEENNFQLYIPRGFAHGFITLTDNVLFSYHVDNDYNKESDGGIIYNDKNVDINWGLSRNQIPILSDKDKLLPTLEEANPIFTYKKTK